MLLGRIHLEDEGRQWCKTVQSKVAGVPLVSEYVVAGRPSPALIGCLIF